MLHWDPSNVILEFKILTKRFVFDSFQKLDYPGSEIILSFLSFSTSFFLNPQFSRTSELCSPGFAGGLCFFLLYQHQWPILQLWLGLSVMYLLITGPVRWAFEQFTVHRGIFHSLLACCLFALLVCALSYYLLHKPMIAWVFACFTFFGAMLHLLLDECFSVDLMNQRVKRSFGTALKLWDYQHLVVSLLMLCVCLLLLFVVPSFQSLLVLPSLFGQIYWW